jgi:hypothetical protein
LVGGIVMQGEHCRNKQMIEQIPMAKMLYRLPYIVT